MRKGWLIPPERCVIIEMEEGASIGYRKAVLLSEIRALHSLEKAAKTSRIDSTHARELVFEMNEVFSGPLVLFHGNPQDCDLVQLTARGESVTASY